VTKRVHRPLFLGATAALFFAVVALAHEVMLPFVLAIVIAYVLTPLVSWVERRKIPRGAAIILVYVVVLGTLYLFVRLTAPRVGHELRGLASEAPRLAQTARSEWIPKVQEQLQSWGLGGKDDAPLPEEAEEPAIVVRPREDGSYQIDIGRGVAIEPQGNDRWLVAPREPKGKKLDVARLFDEGLAKTIAWVQENAVEVARVGSGVVLGAARGIFVFGITLMLAAYLMLTRERIFRFFTSLVRPSQRGDFEALLARIDRGLSGVVRGQLVICMVNGVLSAIGFAIVGLKYWPVLALLATVLSLIPIFGSIISSIPAVALGLTQGIGTAVFVLVWIIVIHQLEANLLNPKILGDAAKIHPVLVVFSLIVGEHFFHAPGALLAVPVMSICQSLFLHFRWVIDREDPELAADSQPTVPPPAREA
jgi:predicted PurR-regulated permease PerM